MAIHLLDQCDAPLGTKYRAVALMVDGYLRVYVYADRAAMGDAAWANYSGQAKTIIDKNQRFNSIFAAAPSQNDVLWHAAEDPNFPWEKMNFGGQMDEYVGLRASDPRSFRHYHNTHLWGPLLSKGRSVNPYAIRQIIGEAASTDIMMEDYAKALSDNPPDIVQLGIGRVNGHIAFNDPPEAFFDDMRLIYQRELAPAAKDQQVAEGHFRSVGEVPQAITLTIPALRGTHPGYTARNRDVCLNCVVPTAEKATAVEKMVLGPVTEDVPATILRRHSNAHLFLDLDAAHLLHGHEGIDLTPLGFDPRRYETVPRG